MSKKKTQTVPTPRPSNEITGEYQNLCLEIGNAFVNFEIQKSQFLAKYKSLNEEMQRAQVVEAEVNAKLAAELKTKGEKLIHLVADEVSK